MEEGNAYKNVLGRRVIIAIPIIFVIMAVLFLLMAIPPRYQFKVTNGPLALDHQWWMADCSTK